MKSSRRTILYFAATVLITALLSSALTIFVINRRQKDVVTMSLGDYAALSDAVSIKDLADTIGEKYFGDAPSYEDLIESAKNGMVDSLGDPYAHYYTNEEYEEYLESLNGQYTGIGIVVGQPDESGSKIFEVYENQPAAKAGIQVGDIIVSIDGKDTSAMTLEEISNAVAGEVNTEVKLTILRGSETQEVTVLRGNISVSYVHSSLFKEETGYIRIDKFGGNCLDDFTEAVRNLRDRGMRSLVNDLRNNPGGSLDVVVGVADVLLDEGVIVTVKDKAGNEQVHRSKAGGMSIPLAVIVNENSASASEILAGAIKDRGAGAVVGKTTFGKGIVQTTFRLESGAGWVKLTTDAYYTPGGINIHGVGIAPDIECDLPDSAKGLAIGDIPQEDDDQLWAALDYVREKADQAE